MGYSNVHWRSRPRITIEDCKCERKSINDAKWDVIHNTDDPLNPIRVKGFERVLAIAHANEKIA